MTKLKTPIIYGFVIALVGSVLMVSLIELNLSGPKAISLETEMAGGTILFLMLYLLLLFGIYFAIKKRKDSIGMQLSFKEAVLQGFAVSITTVIASVLFTVLFYELLYPTYVSEVLEALQDKMERVGVPNDKLLAKIKEKKDYYSTATQSLYSFVGNLVTGVAFTLLFSFFLKTKIKK